MPRIAVEAKITNAYARSNPSRSPPSVLTEEQKSFWREIIEDLPANHIRSDCAPTLVELVRHLSYAAHIAESLNLLRGANLVGNDEDREAFIELTKIAREESGIIALLSTKLRLVNQARDNSVVAKRARLRTPTGRRPWDVGKPLDDGDGLDS
jgi:hypothetical protein